MQLALRIIAILSFAVAIIWMIIAPGFEPLLAFLAGISTLLASFAFDKSKDRVETLAQRNRRVMLNHVENFWVKGILEKSLHGAALLELGIREDLSAINYPWTIKKEVTNEIVPAGKSMLEIFQEIGLGRSLLILGAPGSGKTTMLLDLARQLIQRARQDETEPIPVVFNLASWTEKQSLADWLVEQLNIVYSVPKKIAPSWVKGNKMLLLLDGLDEVKENSRAKCGDAINEFRKERGLISLVVCSRKAEYSVLNIKLTLAGAITLQPLTSEQIDNYIDRFGNSLANIRLLLRKDRVLQELTETPLILSIMALAYKNTKDDEMLVANRIEDQRKHIFDTYIERMFDRSNRSEKAPCTKRQTLHSLSWLARKMIQHNIITFRIEGMQPSWLEEISQYRQYRLYFRLSIGLLFCLFFGLLFGLIGNGVVDLILFGLLGGLSAGLASGLSINPPNRIIMVDRLKWSWKDAWHGFLHLGQRFRPRRVLFVPLFSVLFFVLFVGFLGMLSGELIVGLRVGLSEGLKVALFGLLTLGLISGVSGGVISEQIEETTFPRQRLKQTLYKGLFAMLFGWLLGGLIAGLTYGLVFGLSVERVARGGLLFGPLFGLLCGLISGYVPLIQHYSLRLVLARHHILPHHLVPFLDHAVDLIFLRRVGGSYIFVHRLLMEHFAEMDV